jgi:hypothetical protein
MLIFSQPLSESEKRHFSKYGKWPGEAALVQKPKVHEVAYFAAASSLTI